MGKSLGTRVHPRLTAALMGWVTAVALSTVGCSEPAYPTDPEPNYELGMKIREGGGAAGGAATKTVASTGTGWGILRGKFVLDGAAPAAAFLSTGGKDPATCGQQVPDQSLIVDPSSMGIANIVIFARKVSREFDGAAPPAAEPVFDQKNCIFLSHVFGVRVGENMVIKNSDPVGHNTAIAPPGNEGKNPLLPGDSSTTYKFDRAISEPTAVTCNIHPWMKAYIIARKDPYFAITDAQGQFEILNLPAGEEIEFQIWHERAPDGLAAKPEWSRGRLKVTVPADQANDLGTISVPLSALQ